MSPKYDFQSCVMSRLAEIAGCRSPWDIWASPTVPICDNLDAANKYSEKFFELVWSPELKMISKITGCLTPCTYVEYAIVGEPYKTSLCKNGYRNENH